MKNRGVFQVLKKGDKYKIVYIEKGEILVVYSYDFDRYEDAKDYFYSVFKKQEIDIERLENIYNKILTEKKQHKRFNRCNQYCFRYGR